MDKETFDRQATVVASAWDILDHYNLGFPFAHLYVTKMGTLNKEGKEQVTDAYAFLLQAMDIPEAEYWSFWDMIAARAGA